MEKKKQLVVYLDTSDFARLYKDSLSSELFTVKNYLLEKVGDGTILIPNSYPLMAEFIQDFSTEYKADRLARARFMKKLCGKNAFAFIPKSDSSKCINNRGIWTPEIPPMIDMVIMQYALAWKQVPHLSKYANDLLHHGKRIRLAREHKELFEVSMTTEYKDNNPLMSKYIEGNYIHNFLLKKISRKEIQIDIEDIINDPESYVERVHCYDPLLTKTMRQMHQLSEMLEVSVAKLKNDFVLFLKKLDELSMKKKELLSSGLSDSDKQIVKKLHENLLSKFETKNLATQYFNRLKELLPGYFFDVFDAYLHVQFGPSSRVWKRSDVGDILHSLFIPHSDIWRGDKSFCNMLIDNNVRFSDRIVSNLLDVPQRINKIEGQSA